MHLADKSIHIPASKLGFGLANDYDAPTLPFTLSVDIDLLCRTVGEGHKAAYEPFNLHAEIPLQEGWQQRESPILQAVADGVRESAYHLAGFPESPGELSHFFLGMSLSLNQLFDSRLGAFLSLGQFFDSQLGAFLSLGQLFDSQLGAFLSLGQFFDSQLGAFLSLGQLMEAFSQAAHDTFQFLEVASLDSLEGFLSQAFYKPVQGRAEFRREDFYDVAIRHVQASLSISLALDKAEVFRDAVEDNLSRFQCPPPTGIQ
jgi:hypothetical protein